MGLLRPLQSAAAGLLPLERIQAAITPHVGALLARQGFAVIDGLLGSAGTSSIRAEIAALQAAGRMHLNSTHLHREGAARELLQKANIWEAEMFDKQTQGLAPLCHQLNTDSTLRTMLSMVLPTVAGPLLTLDSQATKLQYNAGGGGCFPFHYDSSEGVDGRRVTAILYLNSGWQPEHGGELELFPLLSPVVRLAPLDDRLVLFSTCRMLHRVAPSAAERYCLTVWLSDARARRTGRQLEPLSAALQACRDGRRAPALLLQRPDVRQHLANLLFDQAWVESIRESHADTPGRARLLSQRAEDVDRLRRGLGETGQTLLRMLGSGEARRALQAEGSWQWF